MKSKFNGQKRQYKLEEETKPNLVINSMPEKEGSTKMTEASARRLLWVRDICDRKTEGNTRPLLIKLASQNKKKNHLGQFCGMTIRKRNEQMRTTNPLLGSPTTYLENKELQNMMIEEAKERIHEEK